MHYFVRRWSAGKRPRVVAGAYTWKKREATELAQRWAREHRGEDVEVLVLPAKRCPVFTVKGRRWIKTGTTKFIYP